MSKLITALLVLAASLGLAAPAHAGSLKLGSSAVRWGDTQTVTYNPRKGDQTVITNCRQAGQLVFTDIGRTASGTYTFVLVPEFGADDTASAACEVHTLDLRSRATFTVT